MSTKEELITNICTYQSCRSFDHYGRKGMKWYQHIYGDFEKGAAYAKKGLVKAGSKAIKTYKSGVNKVAEANQRRIQVRKEAKELRKKAAAEHKAIEKARKAPEQMTNEELKTATDRLKLMNEYNKQYNQFYPDPKAARRAAGKDLAQLALKTIIEKGLPKAFDYLYEKNSVAEKNKAASSEAKKLEELNKRDETLKKARDEKRIKTTKKIERLESRASRLNARRKTLEGLVAANPKDAKKVKTYTNQLNKINKQIDKYDARIETKASKLEKQNERLWKKQKKLAKRQSRLNKLANK